MRLLGYCWYSLIMFHELNKDQSREHRRRVRFVLNKHWDPIGVVDACDVDDEYESYVGPIYLMLIDGRASLSEIEDYLREAATGHMGLPPSERLAENYATTAAILIGLPCGPSLRRSKIRAAHAE